MGLDNGLRLKLKNVQLGHDTGLLRCATKRTQEPWWDITYWRKCWNIREIFLSIVADTPDQYDYFVTKEHIPKLLEAFEELNAETWDCSMSIWTWDDVYDGIAEDKFVLKTLYDNWDELGVEELYFYDSY